MAVKALKHKKIIKKRVKKFTRFECEDFDKIANKWRKPHGIDCRMRRRFRGNKPLVNIGYGSDKTTRYMRRSGFKTLHIQNPQEIELLLMNNRTFAAELAANLSARKRAAIVKRAAQLNVRVTNSKGKVKVDEKKAEN
mmetsp:Transcript_12684/g.10839  ORF Transcript_12684/g.10839 Transcript_12684/m.10839 type:complete len:138 (+) Transcript_12684:76-489(+)|eukprot:CAMPEP_0114585682 /NCGR_PEP_ID=MMETSP0125-20121206/9149_1 /TAXON_ID=485358 ORGANISM="Aristerostoma sp., Strain ATCC 50986" /NCGR_SAMPLE_ID=MMETSP0125 /ASSEMBLY_ACC=CAM_ASM_000245 /LENGTH=137 /DNA_ID=CAMNT_0001780851 /DNA_START=87 /DNA_END=500 /DNA_ORIENTATION=+